MRELGPNQKAALKLLRKFGSWSNGGIPPWQWESPSRTIHLLDTLVRRGLASRDDKGVYRPVEKP